jgi:hypothetical protein
MTRRLHLGCGQIYLEGYTNIDYPLSEHTVQQESVADEFADLTNMRYRPETIDEVRLHHVFEHFPRTQAMALLASWHSWLKRDGVAHIEVPDFDATARLVLGRFTDTQDRKVAIRHIFGSNEASWAVHYDGWSKSRLSELFETFGYEVIKIEHTAYKATRNISIIGRKINKTPDQKKLTLKARNYLKSFTVDDSEFEKRLLDIWVTAFADQLKKTFAK